MHRNARDNGPPVIGKVYFVNWQRFTYKGCGGVSEHQFQGIYQAVEFYPSDYLTISPLQPEYLSTIYWKHQVKVSSLNDAEFSFYTSDITGSFKIIVQGITSNGVTYNETGFNVVKSK